ncbi:hypothetical protein KFE25_011394 [Diacronema lutheri]|uniref:Dynein intermediate chain n=1 Tax=Diacronema lutheri TaxID=2081491 RepID=A0A8J5XAQ2_DIALT|nr:hypothetical protein KFE25_011394 [Diacronema lutheri]
MAPKKRVVKRPEVAEEPVEEPVEQPEGNLIVPGSEWEPAKLIIKPPDQVQRLSDKDLAEEHTRVLKADNPQAPNNLARFSHKEKTYKFDPTVDQTAIALSLEGLLLHVESDDLKRQKLAEEMEREALLKEAERKKAEGIELDADDARGLRNQFNFSERASQTLNSGVRERGTITEPPASVEYAALATQWEIYDSYMDDQERQRQAKEKGKAKKGAEDKADGSQHGGASVVDDIVHSEGVGHAAKILERMANQNAFDDITQDYKYWEDASDAYRDGEGTLLPLWKFQSDKSKRKHVTSIKWNPSYDDMFAVGYGSYDFMKQGSGLICGFSLKNPSYPEFTFTTETGVMCLDWHPTHNALLCVGLYDGTVCVFDVHQARNLPIFTSTVKSGKHTDPVWEVSWQEEDLAKNLNFFSISSDGRVTLWTLGKSNLEFSDVMQLKLASTGVEAQSEDEASLCGLAGGCCFDFNKQSEHLFVVGTEEGKIHKCSKAYNSQYLETYDSHQMAVYTLRWNAFHPHVFISCSADWTVKVWDHRAKHPRMSYDLNNQVGDVAWTPWSSTTFAACTADGKVHVFDLHENKNEAMCEQKVARALGREIERKAKEAEEAAATGGRPSHRAPAKKADAEGGSKKSPAELEVEKLDKILEVAAKTGEFNYAADAAKADE